jgi:hypothetical protein
MYLLMFIKLSNIHINRVVKNVCNYRVNAMLNTLNGINNTKKIQKAAEVLSNNFCPFCSIRF